MCLYFGFPAPDDVDFVVGVDILVFDGSAYINKGYLNIIDLVGIL